jgi:hypothetical protein
MASANNILLLDSSLRISSIAKSFSSMEHMYYKNFLIFLKIDTNIYKFQNYVYMCIFFLFNKFEYFYIHFK